jgi:hypothetical protein
VRVAGAPTDFDRGCQVSASAGRVVEVVGEIS